MFQVFRHRVLRSCSFSMLFLLSSMLFVFTACADLDTLEESGDYTNKSKANRIIRRSTPFINGQEYHTFRTPSLVKAKNGDILAFAGARDGHGDNSRGNVVLRRSKDAGRTWEPLQTIAGKKKKMKDRNGLPSAVTLDDGTIIMVYMWSKYVEHNEDRGCRKMYMKTSTDHGKSWSKKVNITKQTQKMCLENEFGQIALPILDGNWGWTGLGPVHGIVKKHEPNAGRILFAARHVESDNKSYAHIIYSDDRGQNWNIGGSLHIKSSESTVVELPNGDIMLNARSTGNSSNRIVGISVDGGVSFDPDLTGKDESLIEPGCQGSLLRFEDSILFSNPSDTEEKRRGTLKRSIDGGITWEFSKIYMHEDHFSGYSDMVRKNGNIGILFEWGSHAGVRQPHQEIRYIVVPKEAIGF